MRWMLQYRANKCFYKSLRKLTLVTLGSFKLSGNEFQDYTGLKGRKPVVVTVTNKNAQIAGKPVCV